MQCKDSFVRGEALYTLDKMTASRIGTERQTTRPTRNYTSTGYIWIQICTRQCKLNQTNLRAILEFSNASSCTLKIHFLSLSHTHTFTQALPGNTMNICPFYSTGQRIQTCRHTGTHSPIPFLPSLLYRRLWGSPVISFLISFSPLYFSKQSHMHHSEEHTDQVTHCVRTCTDIL